MFNLLPDIEKEKIYRQYRMRRVIVALALLFVILVCTGIFLVPTYILASFRTLEVQNQIDVAHQIVAKQNRGDLEKRTEAVNATLASLDISNHSYAFSDLTEKILSARPSGVRITSLQMISKKNLDNQNTIAVDLSGVADTRDDLVFYRTTLESNSLYSKIDLPVSSLAQERNAQFVIKLEIKYESK